jgi:hypothetical protein
MGPPKRSEAGPVGGPAFASKVVDGNLNRASTFKGSRPFQQEVWRQRLVAHLVAAGARPVLEALLELERGANLDEVLARFARVPVATYRALGADRFAPLPIHIVESAT